jgi:predicted class III extradiol MEMO1 family dioxygenase
MIDGFVTLEDHTPIPGATVTIIAADGTTVTAVTNEIGYYRSTYLAPGTYTLIVTAPNHTVVTRTGVVVLTAQCTQTPIGYYWIGMVCHVVLIHNLSYSITFSCTKLHFGW